MLARLATLFLLVAGLLCASDCHVSSVDYVDTTVVTNPDLSNPDKLLPVKTAFGCVYPEKGKLVVIQRFNGSEPISVLVIPAGAVISITGLVDDVPDETKPRALPNAHPDSVDEGRKPNDKRLI